MTVLDWVMRPAYSARVPMGHRWCEGVRVHRQCKCVPCGQRQGVTCEQCNCVRSRERDCRQCEGARVQACKVQARDSVRVQLGWRLQSRCSHRCSLWCSISRQCRIQPGLQVRVRFRSERVHKGSGPPRTQNRTSGSVQAQC